MDVRMEITQRFCELERQIAMRDLQSGLFPDMALPEHQFEALKKGNIDFITAVIDNCSSVAKHNIGPDMGFAFFRLIMECATKAQVERYISMMYKIPVEERDVHFKNITYQLEHRLKNFKK